MRCFPTLALATTLSATLALSTGADANENQAPAVVALKSFAEPFDDTLVLRGRTEANRRVDVRSQIDGLVESEPLRKGARVAEGDVLCQIAEGDRTAELVQAEATLREAEMNARIADQLVKKGFTSEMTTSTRQATLEGARARLLKARMNAARLTITAPFAGILETDTAELGSLLQNGSVCATLIALDPIKLVAFAPERSVDALTVGADVTGRMITGREVKGKISFVARSADRDTRTYLVEAETPNDDLSIRDGMTTEITVSLTGEMAHLVPQTALTLDDDGALGVMTVVEGRTSFTPASVLRDSLEGVWVSGLPDKADIIIVGQEFVTPGQTVTVEFAENIRTQ